MAKIGLIRCQKNETRCPLTGCFKCLENREQGFSGHEQTELVGVFTCRCPGDGLVDMAKILKSKGADTIHVCTCTFSHKADGKWIAGNGFCGDVDRLMAQIASETQMPCVKGTAHLPEGYHPRVFGGQRT
ncbi:hypothetical protein DSCA_18050 [Desulfosarcina alkanivorans]|uniref:CGGC domain-containing protein n=1 Tax=Desulfosarcina alkanivorans TaxID=571177 RepID=A0A5K7YHK5_9BACT|nr:CGGC domain-containing protein [Desulfosarcina alkanivorans]BBO67875.1 hypothetical protein DSCA_18050 [Desulfosarcina alkanivorans]